MDELIHEGVKRRSGRYEWGSGENPFQHESWFHRGIRELKAQGFTEKEIADNLVIDGVKGLSIRELRQRVSRSADLERAANITQALRYKDKGMSISAIAERMGQNENTVRYWLDPIVAERATKTAHTADILREAVKQHKYVDVGHGTDAILGVSKTKLDTAVSMLKDEGYEVQHIKVKQLGVDRDNVTTIAVLVPPGTPYQETYDHRADVAVIGAYTADGGKTFNKIEPYKSVSSDRVQIRYAEEGGIKKDGVIELRPGVEDISLGSAGYAQVRIGVDGTHYLKGMAIYNPNLPDGVDIVFNTNKHLGTDKMDVLKKMKGDPSNPEDNPFGATVRQQHYIDKDGKEQLSSVNIVRAEGEWDTWSRTLAGQFLSKQSPELIKRQMDLSIAEKKAELETTANLTNPLVRRNELKSFADDCDANAVDLSTAALPRSSWKVILPVTTLSDKEIYAPGFKDGEIVSLVRYPHGGIFEIPTLTVNNKNREAKGFMENTRDAVGINPKTAEILSGADFDGDTVLVIPNPDGKLIRTKSPLAGLKNFDPKESYPYVEGMKVMTEKRKPKEMGMITNLINDITLAGATDDELARAVRHSMVVIDASEKKHKLNYQQSYIDNRIADLIAKYRGDKGTTGASTILSRAKSPDYIDELDQYRPYNIDPDTGKKIFRYTGRDTVKFEKDPVTGKKIPGSEVITGKKKQQVARMYRTDDAWTLVGDPNNRVEALYADYANELKRLADEARKIYAHTPTQTYDASAAKVYSKEVASLDAKLREAHKNAPLERKAQALANVLVRVKLESMAEEPSYEDLKKLRGQTLTRAREKVGAHKNRVSITPEEWTAIQAGAVTATKLEDILRNAEPAAIKQYSLPHKRAGLSANQAARARAMIRAGYTLADVAEQLGVSTTTVADVVRPPA